MSEINNSEQPRMNDNEKKEMSTAAKVIMGGVLGLLTVAGITLSGAVMQGTLFRLMDQNLKLVLRYLWVGFFLVYIFWFRSIETNKGITMKQGRYTYLIVVAVYLVVIFILNLTGNTFYFSN